MATAQLQLVSNSQSWKLDRRTIEVGRAGIAQARAALAAATAPTDADLYGGLFALEKPQETTLESPDETVVEIETNQAA